MRLNRKLGVIAAAILGVTGVANAALAEVVVVTSPETKIDQLSKDEVAKIWLGKIKRVKGQKLIVVDQPESESIRQEFYQQVTNKNTNQAKAYWAKISFSGKAFPPKQLQNDSSVIQWLLKNPGTLGYVEGDSVTDNVSVVFRD